MSGYDLSGGFDRGQAIASITRGLVEEIQRGREKNFLKEVEDRKSLAAEFEKLAEDQALDEADRRTAAQHARALRLLPLEKKRPKEYLPDEKLKNQTGDPMGIPAMVPLLYKKVMKEGPKPPAKPTTIDPPPPMGAPAAPQARGGIPSPPGLPPGMTISEPPIPGGEQQGPNAISPAPGLMQPIEPAFGDLPGNLLDRNLIPPPPGPGANALTESWEPKFRTQEQIALENARLKGIENTITMNGQPVDVRALPALGRQQTAIIQMRKLGLNPDGSEIPEDQLTPQEQAMIAYRRTQADLAEANIELAQARAKGIPQYIEIARDRAASAQQRAEAAAAMVGTFLPVTDEQGNIIGGINTKTWGTIGPPDLPGARKTALSAGELDKRSAITNVLSNLDELERLGNKHSDRIGVLKGRLTGLEVNWIGADAEINELFRLSDDIADQLLRARSGAAITESEFSRLRKLVPDPRSPLEKFKSDLQGFRKEAERMFEAKETTGKGHNVESSTVPPLADRVVDKTTAIINGRKMVWKGAGWAPVKK